MKIMKCTSCNGTGRIKAQDAHDYPDGCCKCDGTGKYPSPYALLARQVFKGAKAAIDSKSMDDMEILCVLQRLRKCVSGAIGHHVDKAFEQIEPLGRKRGFFP